MCIGQKFNRFPVLFDCGNSGTRVVRPRIVIQNSAETDFAETGVRFAPAAHPRDSPALYKRGAHDVLRKDTWINERLIVLLRRGAEKSHAGKARSF
jgi:hypothetical protein